MWLLPPELVLNVLKYLPLQEVHQLQLASREWNRFIAANESAIYHAAAVLHGFAGPDAQLSDARGANHGPWLDNILDWKDLCQRWIFLERNWTGRGEPPAQYFLHSTKNVHRFKTDETHRFVVTTHSDGGLRVTSMDDDTVLFRLSRNHVRRRAHIEYANGYIVFDRSRALEVWRLVTDDWNGSIPASRPHEFLPHASQREAHIQAYCAPGRRGSFAPWALLVPPENTRAYRFVFPTLLTASETARSLYLFDIPSATLVKTTSLAAHPFFAVEEPRVFYVELSARHAFVCAASGVVIVPRADGAAMATFPEIGAPWAMRGLAAGDALQVAHGPVHPHNTAMRPLVFTPPTDNAESRALVPVGEQERELVYTGLHVSSCGRHFVAITWRGVMYFVRDFERAVAGHVPFSEITVRVNLAAPMMYLAFEYGRAAIQTAVGIHIVVWDIVQNEFIAHTITYFPNTFMSLDDVDCIQLTQSCLWLTWSLGSRERGSVCYVDFSRQGLQV